MLYELDDVLLEMASEDRKHFSPHYVCKRSGINDFKAVSQYLVDLVNKKLKITFEVECPEGDGDFNVPNLNELDGEIKTCHLCQREYIPDPERIWIYFDFKEDFIEYAKKKSTCKTVETKVEKRIKPAIDNKQASLADFMKYGVIIEQMNVITSDEEVNVMFRKMGDISNSKFGDNINFQGDDVRQSKIEIKNSSLQKDFEELFNHINEMVDGVDKTQAKYNAQELQKAIESGEKEKSSMLHSFLLNTLGAVSSVVTIGQFISQM